MIKIDILISTNGSNEEMKNLEIPREAIDEFLGNGYATDLYEGNISFQCRPRAISPNFMEVFITLTEIAEKAITWGTILKCLMKFFKKCKGYTPVMQLKYKKDDKELSCSIPLKEGSDEVNILKEIEKIINND